MGAETLRTVEVNGLTLSYRDLGSGPPVLLLHGWPTSSYLWREIMPAIARENRVVALDLPGFGASEKPLDSRYDFGFFGRVLDGFLEATQLEEVAIGAHDLGGPVGLHWALHRPERVRRIALLNTLVYPDFSDAVLMFLKACTEPELRDQLTSPQGLEAAMRLGLADESRLTAEVIAAVREPFATEEARRALAAAGSELEPAGFEEIERRLPRPCAYRFGSSTASGTGSPRTSPRPWSE